MRERATVAGGQVTAGPVPGAGFLVEALLPTKGGLV
jgi:signal transduction histidine kinase